MTDRATIARDAAAGLRRFADAAAQTPVLVGFDGFVDSIIEVVDKRQTPEKYDAIPTIQRFGEKIVAAAGQSSNYELVTTLQKLGGNGPIMADALAAAGLQTTYIGALGHPALHPVFEEFAKVAEVHSVSEPGFTDALEFADGKLMLGKHDTIRQLDWETVEGAVGVEQFGQIVRRSRLIGMVNWTMLGNIESVWEQVGESLPPKRTPGDSEGADEQTLLFIDLADPEKRTDEDLQRACRLVGGLEAKADVVFGLNLKESTQVAAVLGLPVPRDREAAIEETARAIRERLDVYAVVVHPRRGAAGAIRQADGSVASAAFEGPFTSKPRLSTGAGDNFNAGFCLGLLAGLPVDQALCVGTATSGYYVRHAASPTLEQLAAFCDDLPSPA